MNRSAKGLLIVTTNLDDFNLANCRRFDKFTKLPAKLSCFTVSSMKMLVADSHNKEMCNNYMEATHVCTHVYCMPFCNCLFALP